MPSDVIVPIIQRYLDCYETNGWGSKAWGHKGLSKPSAATILAERAGITPDSLYRYLKGRTKEINFYIVDRLLCAMDMPMAWQEWPLLPFYQSVDLSVEPNPPQRVICIAPGHCRNGHKRTSENTTRNAVGKIRCRDCDRAMRRKIRARVAA